MPCYLMIECMPFRLILVKIIKRTPVTERVIEFDVAPMIAIVSVGSRLVFRVL